MTRETLSRAFNSVSPASDRSRRAFLALCVTCGLSILLVCCRAKPAGELTTPVAATGTSPPAGTTPAASITVAPSPERALTPTASDTAAPALEEYTVQKGDTLLGLAVDWGVPMAAIQLANDMGDSTVVMVGMPLSIPSKEGWEEATPFWVLHVVQKGETLSHISKRYGVSIERLQEVNGLADSDSIRAGQELILPLKGTVSALVPTPTTTPVLPTSTSTHAVQPTTVVTSAANASTQPGSSHAARAVEPPPSDVSDWPRETARLINEVRADHGLPAFAYNDTLAQAAQAHANDCVQRGSCSHTGSDGSNIKTRVRRAGYDGVGWAECWAQRQNPQGAVDIWMDEVPPNDPHRRTLLHTWLTEIGIGVAETTWGYYIIADFGRP